MRCRALLHVAVILTLALGGDCAMVNVLAPTPRWTFTRGDGNYCSPSLRNNTVFVGAASGVVHALDRSYGTLLWTSQVDDSVNGSIGFDDVMIDAPEIYIPTVFGTVYALNGETGTVMWKRMTQTSGIFHRPAVYNRSVYVAVEGEGLWLINASGAVVTSSSGIDASIQRAVDGTFYLFAAGTYGAVMQYNLLFNGSSCVFSLATITTPMFRPVVMGPLMIVNDDLGTVFAVDYTKCQRRWNRTLPIGPNATVHGDLAAAHELGIVLVTSTNGHVAAVDAYTGAVRWLTNVSGLHFSTTPLVADGYVFVLDLSGVIVVLSAVDGKLLQRLDALQPSTPRSRLAYSGGVLVASLGSTVAAFAGTRTTSPATNVPTAAPTDTAAPLSFAVLSHCSAFNCASGCEHAKYPLNTCVALSNATSVWRTCAHAEMRVQVFDSSDQCVPDTSSSTRFFKVGQCFNDAESGGSFVVESC